MANGKIEPDKGIAKRLRDAREDADITQMEFAERLGISRNTASEYESGEIGSGFAMFKKICEVLNVDANYLIGRDVENMISVEGLDAEGRNAVRIMIEQLKRK